MQTKNLSLYHIIQEPKIKKEHTPALFLFHGYGSDEKDLFSFASELPEELFIISVRAPHPMQPYGNAWYAIHWDASDGKLNDVPQAIASRDAIVNFIEEAITAYDLDPTNISLLGFSQGAILSYAVALSYPEKVKNIVALSGYISADFFADDYTSNDFSKLNIYCSHGSVDQVIPIQLARQTPSFLKSLGITTTLNEFPVGHGVAPQNFYQFKEWLSKLI